MTLNNMGTDLIYTKTEVEVLEDDTAVLTRVIDSKICSIPLKLDISLKKLQRMSKMPNSTFKMVSDALTES